MNSRCDREKLIDMLSHAGIHHRQDCDSPVRHRYWQELGPEVDDRAHPAEGKHELAGSVIGVYDDAWSDFYVTFRFCADGSLLSVGSRE